MPPSAILDRYGQAIMRNFISTFFILFPVTIYAQTDDNCWQTKLKIESTLSLIDSLRDSENYVNYSDSIDSLSGVIINILTTLAHNDQFKNCKLNDPYQFGYLVSNDKKICISSWDTRQGG